MKKPYKNFDLPTRHLTDGHYVPPRARRVDEIERRHSLVPGALLAEKQAEGLRVAAQIFDAVAAEGGDMSFVIDALAVSGLNTSWYSFARSSDVMRRRLELPALADDDEEWRETREGLLIRVREGLIQAIELAEILRVSMAESGAAKRYAVQLGRHMGNVSLQLACIKLGSAPLTMDAFDIQALARQEGLSTLEQSRIVADQVGANPSVAQLADPDSPLSVYWRRNAPDGAYAAYEQAIEEAEISRY